MIKKITTVIILIIICTSSIIVSILYLIKNDIIDINDIYTNADAKNTQVANESSISSTENSAVDKLVYKNRAFTLKCNRCKREDETSDKHGDNTLQCVTHNGDDCRNFTDTAQYICKACIAAAHLTDILFTLCHNACDKNSRVDTAEKIRNQCRKQNHPPAVC